MYDDTADMVTVAAELTRFLAVESCGQCPPCKRGSMELTEILTRISMGAGSDSDLGRIEVDPAQDLHVLIGQCRLDLCGVAPGMPTHQLRGTVGDPGELLTRGEPVRALDGKASLEAAQQSGDAHHVELVEIAGEDGEELGPLQQRHPLVVGQGQDPGVEVEPGQLPVAVAHQFLGVSRQVGEVLGCGHAARLPAHSARGSGDVMNVR